MLTIFRKELSDHFSSTRFLILTCLIIMIAVVTTYMVGAGLREELDAERGGRSTTIFLMLFTSSTRFFSLAQFIALFGPLMGLVMGFDSINRERATGTLSKLVSQPIYRDAVINGKFLAGVTTISIMLSSLVLLISGLGLLTIGVIPGIAEVARLFVYLLISIAYVSFWLGLSILFSIFFRSIATSALASLALWIFLSFFIAYGASLLANVISPVDHPRDLEMVLENKKVERLVSLGSPVILYSEATSSILNPFRRTTKLFYPQPLEGLSMERFQNPLPLDQSVLVVLPYLITLLSLTAVCFAISYLAFMRQEIRSV